MGGHAYWYVVPYEANIQSALDKLRLREFKAGRYNPVMPLLDFPITDNFPSPGPRHRTIDEALDAAQEDGTRSILDISSISDGPEFFSACPLDEGKLLDLYGTTKPTREAVEPELAFLEDIDRGNAIYLVLYENDAPSEILFAGYSFD